MTALQTAIGAILDNYADAIEGGNTYASGTVYKGVAGTQSANDVAGTTVTATAGSTTTVEDTALSAAVAAQAVSSNRPKFFLLCTSQASGSGNTGAARPITAHDGTDTFTVAPAFAETVQATDTFTILEGFRRTVDNWDIDDEDAGSPEGWDRYFSLTMMPGQRLPWYGNGIEQYKSTLELRLRFLKRSRERNITNAALENALRIRSVITRPDHRDGTYTQLLEALSSGPTVEFEDKAKIVVLDTFGIIYRVESNFI